MKEPVLTAEDLELWAMWQRTALIHAQSSRHRRRVDQAKASVRACLEVAPNAAVMWSGGKDSTALTHLVCVEMGLPLRVFSEKDDLDFPEEREYVERLGRAWCLDLQVIVPAQSPSEWIREHAHELTSDGDFHSRAAGLSKACFYGVVEAATVGHAGILLGLRKEESAGRLANRAARGLLYRRASGQWTCNPLSDWSGLDVMAYLAARQIDLLPVYRCISLRAAQEPWRIRKSWWLPGGDAAYGGIIWLRRYYPSLYRQLAAWLPDTDRQCG